MNQIAKSKLAVVLSGLFAAVTPLLVQAAPPTLAANQPDAGIILDSVRSKDFGQPKKPAPGIDVQQESRPAMKPADGFKTKVSAFRIIGATVFPEAQLQSRIAASIGQELTLADLEKVAAEISRFYRENGYFVARAYLPAQEIKDGVVEIAVLEGKIGDVGVKLSGDGRISASAVKEMVAGSVKQGDIVSEEPIERGLLLANDLAGVQVKSTLVPGASVGTSDLVIEANQMGAVGGSIDYDNYGNKFTGQSRLGGSANFNSPAGIGDQLTLRLMTAGSGLNYGRASYLLPVGGMGTKLGVAYSGMHYKLGKDFSSLNVQGDAKIASLFAVHPFVRSRNFNLYGQLGYDNKNLFNEAGAGTTSDKRANVLMAGISGDTRDGLGGGGMNSFSATYASGNLDLGHWVPDRTADAIAARADGGYNKLNYSLARLQRLDDDLSLYAAISGQSASKNLDSSEKFTLGGPSGVRAYPQGEASGDEGYLINAELRWDIPGNADLGNLQLVGFVDTGRIRLHKNLWTNWQGTNPALSNDYSLSGAGIGLNLNKAGDYAIRASLATKLGNNPGRDGNNNDSDNTSDSSRFWLQAIKWF